MATIHLILTNKGGSGKTVLTTLISQFLKLKGKIVKLFDLDCANHSLSLFKGLNVEIIDVMKDDDIDPRVFDTLMEQLLALPEDSHAIIDNGASTFISMISYLRENNALEFLRDNGHKVYIHSLVVGGAAMQDTIDGCNAMLRDFPNIEILLWLNPYFGAFEMGDIKSFFKFDFYKENSHKFKAIIALPDKKKSTFGVDIETLMSRHLTYEEAINSTLPIMTRQRLATYWNEVVDLMEQTQIC